MKGIKRVCTESKHIPNGFHLQVMLDTEKNEVFTGELLSVGSFEKYHNEKLVFVCTIGGYISMENVKKAVDKAKNRKY